MGRGKPAQKRRQEARKAKSGWRTADRPQQPQSQFPGLIHQTYIRRPEPLTTGQGMLLQMIERKTITFASGPAGSGKTHLPVGSAVVALREGKVERIVIARPAVEAGEKIGFLPGLQNDKLAPYMRPIFDELSGFLRSEEVAGLLASGVIEIAPIGFMRGRTFKNCFVICDEAQNCTQVQLKMLLTRIGLGSKMVVSGDTEQSDLRFGERGYFKRMLAKFEARGNDRIGVQRLTAADVVRHELIGEIVSVLEEIDGEE